MHSKQPPQKISTLETFEEAELTLTWNTYTDTGEVELDALRRVMSSELIIGLDFITLPGEAPGLFSGREINAETGVYKTILNAGELWAKPDLETLAALYQRAFESGAAREWTQRARLAAAEHHDRIANLFRQAHAFYAPAKEGR